MMELEGMLDDEPDDLRLQECYTNLADKGVQGRRLSDGKGHGSSPTYDPDGPGLLQLPGTRGDDLQCVPEKDKME